VISGLYISYQQAKQKSISGTLYSPLKNRLGKVIIPNTKNILSKENFII
jgi:hypothetical protein